MKSIGTGVFSGIKGIFYKPYEGAKKEGAKGVIKGFFKGITGIITKPISGVFRCNFLSGWRNYECGNLSRW